MARSTTHKWVFKPDMRAGAFGWRGTPKATSRPKAARREIEAVRKTDPVAADEGVIALAERIRPAFGHIDTSSGALDTAMARTPEDLAPIGAPPRRPPDISTSPSIASPTARLRPPR